MGDHLPNRKVTNIRVDPEDSTKVIVDVDLSPRLDMISLNFHLSKCPVCGALAGDLLNHASTFTDADHVAMMTHEL